MSQTIRMKGVSAVRSEFHRASLIPSLTGGGLQGAMEVFLAASMASLVFAGPLESALPLGLGLALVAGAVQLIASALLSTSGGIHSSVQDIPALLLSVMVISVANTLGPERALPSVLVLLALSALATGLVLFALGSLRLGGLVRYVPYPVIGGFMAATGWLLFQGGFGAITGYTLALRNLSLLARPDRVVQWLPAVPVAVSLLAVSRRVRNPLAVPGVIGGALAVFYLALAASGTSSGRATELGLLFRADQAAAWRPLSLETLNATDWTVVLGQAGNIAVLAGMTLVGLLLGVSAIELAIGRELDLNRELKAAGVGNVLSGLAAGLVGYHALSSSVLSARLGARGRLTGVIAGLLCLAAVLAGPALLARLPKALIGGMIMFLGLDFLVDWVVLGWSRFSRVEYAIVLLILGVIAATNFLTGVGVGLLTMVILFVVSYSRTQVVRHAYSGADVHSVVVRSPDERRQITDGGAQVEVLELQGFLFFGTANALLERVRHRLAAGDLPVRFILIDFRLVTGIDSSAALALYKCEGLARAAGAVLVLTGASPEDLRRLRFGGLNLESQAIQILPDLDRGMEWCEDQILASRPGTADRPATASELLRGAGMAEAEAVRLAGYLEQVEVGAGQALFRKGESADAVYFVLVGKVSVWTETTEADHRLLRTLGPGTTVGEVGLYLGASRTATVLADVPTRALRISRSALETMRQRDPELLASFHEMIARQLSEWVVQGDRGLRALQG